ncbi:insulinase family protein [Calditrichota bacterium]
MRKNFFTLSLSLLLILAFSFALHAEYNVGESYHGFKLKDKHFVKEVNADCYYFEHEKSGARLLKIAADDPNKTFSISFKTVPESDAGTPHIMEHSVLNGSKNFPVKSPFDVLSKGSLNTFLNAFTGKNITSYPVASMNDKDFFNLMYVYLDAVLNPLIYDDPRILNQEGWHHELTHKDSAAVYKGVVYNEMKGAFSSPTRELDYQIYKELFPDNAYRYSSGGYPQAIPTLTRADFLNFHKKYYHPSNSYIYLYGNADLDKELQFIDAEYLSKYEKSDAKGFFPLQKPFKEMKKINAYYSAAEDAKTEDQTYLALNYVSGLNTDQKLLFALQILDEVLVSSESAPLRLALQEAGIGKEVNAYVDDLKQNVFQIVVQNANPDDTDKFYALVTDKLKEIVKNGLDENAVEGTLNRIEFNLREGDDAQKGLTYNYQAMNSWFFADDPFPGLEYEKPLAELKETIKEGYLESVIKKYFIDNNHVLLLTMQPKPGLEKENDAKIAKELDEFTATLSDKDKETLVKETNELIDYQKREDSEEALATIPLLDIKDINRDVEWYDVSEQKVLDVPVIYHETFTNSVVYTRLNFDLQVLPVDMIPYTALLAEVMGSLNTENYTYGDLDNALNKHTGGFNTSLTSYLKDRNDKNLMPKFVVSSKAMNNKIDKMFELIEEIVNKTNYTDKDRLKAILTRHQSRLDSRIKRDGLGYARTRMQSYYSNQGMFNELRNGIEYYWFVTDLVDNFEEKADDIISNLSNIVSQLFTKENLVIGSTCSNSDFSDFLKQTENFINSLPSKKSNTKKWTFNPEKKNEGLLSASKVQYVIKGYDIKKLGYEWNGKIRVLNQILSREFIRNQVRVIGGAYGGWTSFSPTGQAYFGSYRDPNLSKTLENYDSSPGYLNDFTADDQTMTRFIIGTISRLDQPMTPSEQGNLAFRRSLEGTTKSYVQEEREAVLATTVEDIKSMKQMVSDVLSQNNYCVYGNEEKLKSEKDLFKELVKLSK